MHFGQLTLEEADVCLEIVRGSHLDRKEVVVVLLELLKGGVIREGQLGEIFEVADRLWRKREAAPFKLEGKIQYKMV